MKWITIKSGAKIAAILVIAIVAMCCGKAPVWVETGDENCSTSSWSQVGLKEAQRIAEDAGATAFILLTDGKTVASWGDLTTPTSLHSAVKAILSTLVAMNLGEGPKQIPLHATLEELEIDDVPPLSDEQRQIRVIDLLRSVSGVTRDAASEVPNMRREKRRRLEDGAPPGTTWAYNNWDYNVLITILQMRTETSLVDLFLTHLASPLGMQDIGSDTVTLVYDWPPPGGYSHPHVNIVLSARDMARFGQLHLDHGNWNGQQLLPEDWTTRIRTDYERTTTESHAAGAHSYLWWLPMGETVRAAGVPEGTYYASGLAGQKIVIFPEWNSVLVLKADTRNFDAGLELFARERSVDPRAPDTMDAYLREIATAECGPINERTGWCAMVPFVHIGEFAEIVNALIAARTDTDGIHR